MNKLILKIGLAITLLASSSLAFAASGEGFGAWIIDSLFEAGTLTNQPATPGLIGTVIMPLNLICMVVATIVILFKATQHLLIVAQAKDMDASPVSMTWAPLHLVIAVILIMPWPSGYSAGQYFAIYLSQQSNALGNVTANRATGYFRTEGVITPPPLPSVQDLVKGIVASQMCMELQNEQANYMQGQGGTRITVSPRVMTPNEVQQVAIRSDKNLTSAGVLFERNREGGFVSEGTGINDYCGALLMQFNSSIELPTDGTGLPTTVAEEDSCDDGWWGMSCWLTSSLGYEGARKNLINSFAGAHTSSINAVMNSAMDDLGAGAVVAQQLLFDVNTHFAGLQDSTIAEQEMAIQAQESQYLDDAVINTVALIDDLQRTIYSSYAQSINQHLNTKNNEGEDWLDAIDRVGWPIFGLYWFQMTNTSQRVMESVSLNAHYTGDAGEFLSRFHRISGDTALALRLQQRYAEYERRLSAAIRNTRLDPNPLIGPKGRADAETAIREAENAKVLREIFPMIKNDMIDLAGAGSTTPTDVGGAMFAKLNDISRGHIFPWVINALRGDSMVNSLVNAGHKIIAVSEIFYLLNTWSKSGESTAQAQANESQRYGLITRTVSGATTFLRNAAQFISSPPAYLTQQAGQELMVVGSDVADHQLRTSRIGNVIIAIMEDAFSYWKYVFFLGLFLAFYLPAMIMIQWLIGLITWIIYVVEATVVIPLWGLLFVGDMGEKAFAPSTARQGFVHMLSILIYPALMVIGFTIGLKVIDLSSVFFVDFLLIGFMNVTDGYLFGILSFVFGLFIIGFACYQIIMRVFSIVLELNDRAISWIGQRISYGEGNVEGQVRGGFMAVLSKAEMNARFGDNNSAKKAAVMSNQQK